MGAIAKRALPALVIMVGAIGAPMAAHAAPVVPGAQPITLADAPAGEFCAFPVKVTALDGTKPIPAQGEGIVVATGAFTITVINETTGKQATFNASGPTMVDRTTGVLILTGPAIVGQPASRHVGPTFLVLNKGRTVFTANSTIASFSGTSIDLCAAVA